MLSSPPSSYRPKGLQFIKLAVPLLLLISTAWFAFAQKDLKARPEKIGWIEPVQKEIEGWTIHIDPTLLKGGEHEEEGQKALKMLANHLQRISILLPKEPLKKMKTMEIWLEHHHPELDSMQYHPGADWLKDRGYHPDLAKKVHLPVASKLFARDQLLKHPAVILHELAHAYHDQVLTFEDPEIIAAYTNAMKTGILENVLLVNGQKAQHYAATNHKEYFAEATEAYLYRNDFYPFVAAELREADPKGFQLMKDIWGPAAVK